MAISDLKYAGLSHYFDQIRAGIKFIHRKSGETKICSMYIPSDFGIEIIEGAKAVAKELNLAYLAETTHKPVSTTNQSSHSRSHSKTDEHRSKLVTEFFKD